MHARNQEAAILQAKKRSSNLNHSKTGDADSVEGPSQG